MDINKHFEVIYLVEWLLLKTHSNNLYVKLSTVRSLGNFSRFSKCTFIQLKLVKVFLLFIYFLILI